MQTRESKSLTGLIKKDVCHERKICIRIDEEKIKWTLPQRFVRAALKVFAPMM